jgi:membrane-associated protein
MFDPVTVLHWLGPFVLLGLVLIIFSECGLLIGLVLPGDPLLFTAGLFAAAGAIIAELWLVCLIVTVAAITSNICGYWIGAKPDRRCSTNRTPSCSSSHTSSRRTGSSRSTAPSRSSSPGSSHSPAPSSPRSPVGRMDPKKYFIYSTIGGVLWAAGMTLLGGLLGQIPWARDNINTMMFLMLIAVVVVSVVPIVNAAIKKRPQKNPAEAK